MEKFDLIVIGAGSGGLVAALTGNRRGLKTALLEKNKIGGECTHSGCVPSKALIQAAKQYHAAQELKKYGLPDLTVPPANFSLVMEQVDAIVQGIYAHETPDIFQNAGIETIVHPSGARFLDAHTVQIGDRILQGTHIIISTGSSPRQLDIPGSSEVSFLDNESFWVIREQPQRIAFIGGGVISAELGQAMVRLGSQVYIIQQNERILPAVDPEAGKILTAVFEKEGISILTSAAVKAFHKANTGTLVEVSVKEKTQLIEVDAVFLGVGRQPNVEGMDLPKAGIGYSSRGIQTNAFMQTSQEHIFACGDVTTPAKFTHTASYQAEIILDNISFPEKRENDLTALPWAIFTGPEVAHVGLSEQEARAQFGDALQVFKVEASIDRFITDQQTGGFLKVYFGPDDKVVGADAIGPLAGEWIQQITLIVKNNIPVSSLAQTIYAYPTYTEIVKKVFSRFLRTKGY